MFTAYVVEHMEEVSSDILFHQNTAITMLRKMMGLVTEIFFLGSVGAFLVFAMTENSSLSLGPATMSIPNAITPLLVLFSALLVRKLATGEFFSNLLCVRLMRWIWQKLRQFVTRWQTSRDFRRRELLLLAIFCGCSLLVFCSYRFLRVDHGLLGRYYNTIDFTGSPVLTVPDHTVDLHRARTFLSTNYSIEWTGLLLIPEPGEYVFTMTSDDGSRLVINQQIIVDDWGFHGLQKRTGAITLKPGYIPITIRYFQGDGDNALHVYWKKPGQAEREPLPQTVLFPQQPGLFHIVLGYIVVAGWTIMQLLWLIVIVLGMTLALSYVQRFCLFLGCSPDIITATLRGLFQYLAIIGGTVLVCICLLDVVLRTGWFDEKGTVWISRKYKDLDHQINQKNHEFAETNPYKFTDTVRTEQKPAGWYRIAILGDSFVWGDGLPYEQAWGHKLERKILQPYEHIEVLNWGIPGWSTLNEFEFLQEHGVKYDIDLLIIGFVTNDSDMGIYHHKNFALQDSSAWHARLVFIPFQKLFPYASDFVFAYLNRFLTDFVLDGYGYKYWYNQLYTPENLQRYGQLLTELSTFCQTHQIPLLLVFTPSSYEPYRHENFAKITPLLDQANIPYLNLYPALVEKFQHEPLRKLWANPANAHPGPAITEFLADEVFQYLRQQGILSGKDTPSVKAAVPSQEREDEL